MIYSYNNFPLANKQMNDASRRERSERTERNEFVGSAASTHPLIRNKLN